MSETLARSSAAPIDTFPNTSRPAAEQHRHLGFELVFGQQEAILGRVLDRIAQCPNPPRNDRVLLNAIDSREDQCDQRVAHS